MKVYFMLVFMAAFIFSGCNFRPADEKAVWQMLETFVAALESGDEDLARACLMDLKGFETINPDISTRVDAESFKETMLAELMHAFRDLRSHYSGRSLVMTDLRLGNQWYQYKGRQSFRDNIMTVKVDDIETEEIYIMGLVLINEQWRIVNLTGIEQIGN